MANKNYGNYQVPALLYQIIALQQQLNDKGLLPYGDLLGYYFAIENVESRYVNTPLDVIAFARPGIDGIHIGFLTDFGQVADLSDAYIVRVSPMNFEQPVEIIARNLHDFLRILCFHPQLLEEDGEQSPLHEQFSTALQLSPIETCSHYAEQLQQLRKQDLAMATLDGIGIVHKLEHVIDPLPLFNFENKDALTLEEVATFFNHAPHPSKLVFLRDAQSKGLIGDNDEVKHYVKEQLTQMGLPDEAARILYPTY